MPQWSTWMCNNDIKINKNKNKTKQQQKKELVLMNSFTVINKLHIQQYCTQATVKDRSEVLDLQQMFWFPGYLETQIESIYTQVKF